MNYHIGRLSIVGSWLSVAVKLMLVRNAEMMVMVRLMVRNAEAPQDFPRFSPGPQYIPAHTVAHRLSSSNFWQNCHFLFSGRIFRGFHSAWNSWCLGSAFLFYKTVISCCLSYCGLCLSPNMKQQLEWDKIGCSVSPNWNCRTAKTSHWKPQPAESVSHVRFCLLPFCFFKLSFKDVNVVNVPSNSISLQTQISFYRCGAKKVSTGERQGR